MPGSSQPPSPQTFMNFQPQAPRRLESRRRKTGARSATVSDVTPTEILRATGSGDWSVTVRTVGPAGTFAMFSTGNNPGESITVPAGAYQTMYLANGDSIYALGDSPGVDVSVSGGETG